MRDPIRGEWFRLVARVLCGLLVLQASEVPALAFVARQDGQGLPTVERMVDRTGSFLDEAGEGLADGWHRGVGSVRRGLRAALAEAEARPEEAPAKASPQAQSAQSGQGAQTAPAARPVAPAADRPAGRATRTGRGIRGAGRSQGAAWRLAPSALPAAQVRGAELRLRQLPERRSFPGRPLSTQSHSSPASTSSRSRRSRPTRRRRRCSAPIAGQVAAVYAYDNCDPADPWKVYDPADPAGSDLTAVDHTDGLWVAATASTTLPIAGTQPPTTDIPLCAGWNLVGYPLAQERPVTSALASITDRLVRVYGYDAADPADPWEVYDPAVPFWANDLTVMQPGRGYWILVSADTVLQYSNQGPPPAVDLLSPADLAEVTAPSAVTGTVTSDLLSELDPRLPAVRRGGAVHRDRLRIHSGHRRHPRHVRPDPAAQRPLRAPPPGDRLRRADRRGFDHRGGRRADEGRQLHPVVHRPGRAGLGPADPGDPDLRQPGQAPGGLRRRLEPPASARAPTPTTAPPETAGRSPPASCRARPSRRPSPT